LGKRKNKLRTKGVKLKKRGKNNPIGKGKNKKSCPKKFPPKIRRPELEVLEYQGKPPPKKKGKFPR